MPYEATIDDVLDVLSKYLGVGLVVTKGSSMDVHTADAIYLGGHCGDKFETGSSFYIAVRDGQMFEVGGSISGEKFKHSQET